MPKVLLADSSITIQKVVELVLGDKGYEVKAVTTGGEALAALTSFNPDVVLADVSLPDINGYELTEKVRENENTKDVPVLLLAGAFAPVDEERKSRVGANDALTKPFEADDLLNKLASLLEAPSAAGEETAEAVVASEMPDAEEAVAEAVEASKAGEPVADAVEASDVEEEPVDITELDEEPVEIEVLEETDGEAVEAALAEEAEEPATAEVAPAAPSATMPEIEMPGKDEILSVVRDSINTRLGDALSDIDAAAKNVVSEHIVAATSGIDHAIKDSVNESLDGITDVIKGSVTESLNTALGGMEQQMLDSLNKGLSEALNISDLKDSLKESIQSTVEKVLWESAPELTQDLIKESLRASMESLTEEVEKVIWETVPDLAESIIRSEIEKIRSKR